MNATEILKLYPVLTLFLLSTICKAAWLYYWWFKNEEERKYKHYNLQPGSKGNVFRSKWHGSVCLFLKLYLGIQCWYKSVIQVLGIPSGCVALEGVVCFCGDWSVWSCTEKDWKDFILYDQIEMTCPLGALQNISNTDYSRFSLSLK